MEEIEALVGQRHGVSGVLYPANGLQPYYQWLVASLHLLSESSAGGVRVSVDEAGETYVRVSPGRVMLHGVVLDYNGGVEGLSAYNNLVVNVWLYDAGAGAAGVGVGAAGSGWPVTGHIKLAEVTLSGGRIEGVVDRRFEVMMREGVGDADAGAFARYSMGIDTQGGVGTPSVVSIDLTDLYGRAIAGVDYLRVRVCDQGGYLGATNATIAPGVNTSTVETVASGVDLVLASHTDGRYLVSLTDAVAETVELRIGAASVSSRRGEYRATLLVTHA